MRQADRYARRQRHHTALMVSASLASMSIRELRESVRPPRCIRQLQLEPSDPAVRSGARRPKRIKLACWRPSRVQLPVGQFVWGIEADFSATRMEGRNLDAAFPLQEFLHSRTDFIGTEAPRVGIAWDRVLLHAKGACRLGTRRLLADAYSPINYWQAKHL